MVNVGTISFILYGVFILIAFGAIIVLYKFLKKEKLELEKIDRLVNFFKTVVYATAFSSVALIVANLFQERKQIIVELEYFDKYIEEIKQVNGEGRLQLSKFFSIVAPSGEMKKSWTNYYNVVQKERDVYDEAMRENKNDTIQNPTPEQLIKREENQKRIERFEKPLITTPILKPETGQRLENQLTTTSIPNHTTGQLMIYSNSDYLPIEIWIDGNYQGTLNSYFSEQPNCGQEGTITATVSVGERRIEAKYKGYTFNTREAVEAGKCVTRHMDFSKLVK